ncbi:unnamed protein product [Linum trigynum]|uniref:Reverse transcriptase zinc-binding domain-containing protein n=1 Tax=Linum trigynum TaxID=586398 RepID=A0AAV2FH38_9ROSI
MSNLWRGVIRVWDKMDEATVWNMGDGRTTKFWTDRWVTDGDPLVTHAADLPSEVLDMTVSEFVLNGEWNRAFIDYYLPNEFALQVYLHPVPAAHERDIRCWRFSSDGRFNFKTAYEFTAEDAGAPNHRHPKWRAIWRAPVMQRTRTFLWLATHQRLLTNVERRRRHLTTDNSCKTCGGGPETTLHVLRDCPFARGVWAGLLEDEPDRDFYGKSLEEWMFHYYTGRGRVVDATLFAGTCWLLWKNRNNFCFQGELQSFAQIQFHSAQLRQSIIRALEKETIVGGAGRLHTPTPICWQHPEPGWTCLNTDGSVNHSPSSTAAGGVVRGDDGRFIIAFTMNLERGGGGFDHQCRVSWN